MGFVRDITGKTSANAARRAGEIQSDSGLAAAEEVRAAGLESGGLLSAAGQQAGALYDPFQQLGQSGVDQAGFLTDPNAQFDFLQSNPLFQMGLDNANTQTMQSAAARGRLSSGDTLQQLNQNALLTASPLIAQQKQSIGNLLTAGQNAAGQQASILQNTAANQANILGSTAANAGNFSTGAAAAQAGGIVGQANARADRSQNVMDLGSQLLGFFSDPLLKENIKLVGVENNHNIYTWNWNETANGLGLTGSSKGVMADEVYKINPDAITIDRGFMKVDYSAIGVKH